MRFADARLRLTHAAWPEHRPWPRSALNVGLERRQSWRTPPAESGNELNSRQVISPGRQRAPIRPSPFAIVLDWLFCFVDVNSSRRLRALSLFQAAPPSAAGLPALAEAAVCLRFRSPKSTSSARDNLRYRISEGLVDASSVVARSASQIESLIQFDGRTRQRIHSLCASPPRLCLVHPPLPGGSLRWPGQGLLAILSHCPGVGRQSFFLPFLLQLASSPRSFQPFVRGPSLRQLFLVFFLAVPWDHLVSQ